MHLLGKITWPEILKRCYSVSLNHINFFLKHGFYLLNMEILGNSLKRKLKANQDEKLLFQNQKHLVKEEGFS
jgi:N-acetylglutamate synthase-like GNAT family acetyltransferase